MKLHDGITNIDTNLTNFTSFSIKTSPKAFKILSDNLYSGKISAIICEYGTNAYDSHIEAGEADKPFIVHLPSYEEPWFSVQDFGSGMSDLAINTLFTTYFDSNKTESNEPVGALGLGSKSAFAYTDSFIVESVFESVYRAYTCFIGGDGAPKISKLVEQETDQFSGIIIKINVKKSDISEFISKASKIYYFFDTPPTIINCNYNFPLQEVLLSGADWKLIKLGPFNKTIALQGNVYYPINEYKFSDFKHRFVLANNFIVNFPIGSLETAANRETLSYDELTIKNIESRLNQVFDEFFDLFIKEIRQEQTEWKANIKHTQLVKKFYLKEYSSLPILYNGNVISGKMSIEPKKHQKTFITYKKDRNEV